MKRNYDVMTGEEFSRQLDANGHELLSSEPHERAQTSRRPETIAEQVRRLVQSSLLAEAARDNNMESFDEADDFDVGDDFDPSSPYEETFDPPLEVKKESAVTNPADPVVNPSEAPAEGSKGVDAPPSK